MLDKRKKDVIVAINDLANDGRDVSWLWDVDFDKLYDENLNTLTTTGIRLYDISLRFKYADVKVDYVEKKDEKCNRAVSQNGCGSLLCSRKLHGSVPDPNNDARNTKGIKDGRQRKWQIIKS